MVNLNYKFTEILDGVWSSVYEIISIPKKSNSPKIKAKVVMPNKDIECYNALLSKNLKFVYIPILGRVFFNAGLYRERGRKTAYVSYSYQKTLDIDSMKVPLLIKAVMNIHYLRIWNKVKIENIEPTLDMNLLDNDLSINFSADVFDVLKTKAFEFMENIPRRTWILSMLVCFLTGSIIGALVLYIMLLLLG